MSRARSTFGAIRGGARARLRARPRARRESEELLDLRMQCLDDRLTEAGAVATQLAQADAAARFVELSSSLPSLSRCDDALGLRALDPLPADAAARARIHAVRERVAQVQALDDAGRVQPAAAALDELMSAARATGYAPVVAEALGLRAAVLSLTDAAQASAPLFEAVAAAMVARNDTLVARLWLRLVYLDGYELSDDVQHQRRAQDWLKLADAAIRRSGGGDALEFERLHARIAVDIIAHAYVEVEELAQQMIAVATRLYGPSDPKTAQGLQSLAIAYRARGRKHEAIDSNRRALAVLHRSVGELHPLTAMVWANLGYVYADLGRYEESLDAARRALAIEEAVYGADSPRLREWAVDVSLELIRLRRLDEAERLLEKQVPHHPATLIQRAMIALLRHDFAAARRLMARPLAATRLPTRIC